MILLKSAAASTGPKVSGVSTVEFIGASIGTTSATLPPHIAGDLIIGFAWNPTTPTIPSIPSGWTSISSGGDFTGSLPTPDTMSYRRVGWRVAVDASTVSGTWSNANSVLFVVLRGQAATPPAVQLISLGTNIFDIGPTTATYALSSPFSVTDGTSSLLWLVQRESTNTGIDNPPRWCANEYAATQGGYRGAVHLSVTGLNAYPDSTVEVTAISLYQTIGIEILSEPV